VLGSGVRRAEEGCCADVNAVVGPNRELSFANGTVEAVERTVGETDTES